MLRIISQDLAVLVHRASYEWCNASNGITISDGSRVDCATEHSLSDRLKEFFVPEGGSYLRIIGSSGASLTACAFFEPLGVLALPDVFSIPKVLDKRLGAVHKLLPVGNLHIDSGAVPRDVRAVLCSLVDNETEVRLPVLLRDLEDSFVEVQPVNVKSACYLQEELEIVDQVPTEVPEWCGL